MHLPQTSREGALSRLALYCFRRRRVVSLAWVVGVVAVALTGFTLGAPPDNAYDTDSPSARAQALIERHFPERQGDTLTLAIKARGGLDAPATRARVEDLVSRLEASPVTGPIVLPYDDPSLVAPDRMTARTTVPLTTTDAPKDAVRALVESVRAASGPSLETGLGGDAAEKAETPAQGPAEGIGLLAAAVILFLAFGSLSATALPIATALLAVVGGVALMKLVGHVAPAPDFTVLVATLIGLGVGIDYALFILTRVRDGVDQGDDLETATVRATATAGRAVLYAGTTVVIALLGLVAMGQPMMTGVAVGASATVLVTMLAAVTLLPALIGIAGMRVTARRARFGRFRRGPLPRPLRRPIAERWARVVQRHPWPAGIAAAVALLALAAPALSMRLSLPDASVQPHDRSSYAAHTILSEGFGPGFGAPLVLALPTSPGQADPASVADAVRSTEGVALVTPPRVSTDGEAAMFIAYPTTGYQDEATATLVHTLRDDVLPSAGDGAPVYLGGPNAAAVDFAESTASRLPLMVGLVILLSVLLLVFLVRSVTISVQAAVMNVLSIAAAYGVLVAIVQWGWLGRALGFPTTMPITTWVPMMMFPLLFGLSMDYEVFLVSRIREEFEQLGDTGAAVSRGLAGTAKVITSAAAIMIAVFTTALLGPDVSVKQIGLGMAAAVLVDATIIRMVLVPAVMQLCGEANWWMPWARRRTRRAAREYELSTR